MQRWIGLAGIAFLLGVAVLLSRDRRRIRWHTVAWGLALQVLLAFLVLRWNAGKEALRRVSAGVTGAVAYADKGSEFVFGWLAEPTLKGPIFAIKVLPIVIFICSFFMILYHFGVMQRIVELMAVVMRRLLRVSGAEALCVAANVFIGQTEAPVLVAPYIPEMTSSEILTLMTGGMAHVSGAVLLAYVGMGIRAEYLLTASVMAAPGAIVMAKILWPETGEPKTYGTVAARPGSPHANFLDAAAAGAAQGMTLALNIAAMLVAFVALVALVNGALGWVGGLFGAPALTLQALFGRALSPLAWLIGVPSADARTVGNLIGDKTVINEFYAYAEMAGLQAQLSEKGRLIASFALCGFANFASIGVQIGGIGGLAPSRKGDIARLGFRALLAGSLTTMVTAAIAGLVAG